MSDRDEAVKWTGARAKEILLMDDARLRSRLTQLRDEMRQEAGIVRVRSEAPLGSAEKSWVIAKLKRWADTLDEILSGQETT